MGKKKSLSSFTVFAKLQIEASIVINAESLQDALDKAYSLDEEDFIQFLGEYCNGSIRITGMLED